MNQHMEHIESLRDRLIVSLILSIPVFLLSPIMGMSLPFQIVFSGSGWLILAVASVLFIYGGQPFFEGLRYELRQKKPLTMTLVTIGITVMYLYSLYAFIRNELSAANMMDYFWELAAMMDILLLGYWLELKSVIRIDDSLHKISALLPKSAFQIFPDGSIKDVPLELLEKGQLILVKPGGKIPADGVVRSGSTTVNESMVTGEARQIAKSENDTVIGGSINGAGTITVEITATGRECYLMQVRNLVHTAQKNKSRTEAVSAKAARCLFYAALFAGIAAFFIWLFAIGMEDAFMRMITVFVIACPHALGFAIPLVIMRYTSLGAKNGLLIRNRKALRHVREVDIVAMDKTGTLTEGDFHVVAVDILDTRYTTEKLLMMAGSLEKNSPHPVAKGIMRELQKQAVRPGIAQAVNSIPGVGISGWIMEKEIRIVCADYMDKQDIKYNKSRFEELSSQGCTISYLLVDNKPAGLFALGDRIRPQAKRLIALLKQRGITPVMLTGDNHLAAKTVADALNIDSFYSTLRPEDKESIIAQYKEEGHTVMMVGDGINDAFALSRADIGATMVAETDFSSAPADVILVKSDPFDILNFLNLAQSAVRKMTQNLWWSAGYNVVAIPIAAGLLAPLGIMIPPFIGAMLMFAGALIVMLNSLSLRFQPAGRQK